MKKGGKHFFLISFLPAIAYWYLEANYPIRIAVLGGVGLAILEVTLEKIFTQHVHTLSKFNFFILALLGGISLLGEDGIWFKLQPFFTGVGVGGFLLYRNLRGRGLLLETMESLYEQMPPKLIAETMEKHISIFFIIYGVFMAGVALWRDTSEWLFFKTAGFYIVFLLFSFGEIFYLRTLMKKLAMAEFQKKVLASTSANNRISPRK